MAAHGANAETERFPLPLSHDKVFHFFIVTPSSMLQLEKDNADGDYFFATHVSLIPEGEVSMSTSIPR